MILESIILASGLAYGASVPTVPPSPTPPWKHSQGKVLKKRPAILKHCRELKPGIYVIPDNVYNILQTKVLRTFPSNAYSIDNEIPEVQLWAMRDLTEIYLKEKGCSEEYISEITSVCFDRLSIFLPERNSKNYGALLHEAAHREYYKLDDGKKATLKKAYKKVKSKLFEDLGKSGLSSEEIKAVNDLPCFESPTEFYSYLAYSGDLLSKNTADRIDLTLFEQDKEAWMVYTKLKQRAEASIK